jgi:hypothetical protein
LDPAHATSTAKDDDLAKKLATIFDQLPALVGPDLQRRGAWFSERFRVGIGAIPFDVTVAQGRIVSVERGPFLMRSHRFAITASADAWQRLWQPIPEPGWHDLLAIYKRGYAQIDGDLQPLMANLQYVKDVLATPRQLSGQIMRSGTP